MASVGTVHPKDNEKVAAAAKLFKCQFPETVCAEERPLAPPFQEEYITSPVVSESERETVDRKVQNAIEKVVYRAFSQHPPHKIGVAFNGGKDNVAMLSLILEAVGAENMRQTRIFLMEEVDEFEEVRRFREFLSEHFSLTVISVPKSSSKRAQLHRVKEEFDIDAVFLGTRRADGAWQSSAVERCSEGWPDIVRFCPVFDFTYREIWLYTLLRKLPVCPMYLCGYSSIGTVSTTFCNPFLRRTDGSWKPAWELEDDSMERAGRAPAVHSPAVHSPPRSETDLSSCPMSDKTLRS